MNIHEYQGKALFREFGIKVPNGKPAFSNLEAVEVAKELGGDIWVVKAQIHAGGRGKAGGVKLARSIEEVNLYAEEILGKVLVTKQTGPEGKQVQRLLIEEGCQFVKELYLSFTVDRVSSKVVMIGSEEGGMEIEEVAENTPEKIFKEYIDPLLGLTSFQATRMAIKMNFSPETVRKAADIMQKLYQLFLAKDCSLVEINPLVITSDNDVMALDAKINFDDSALFRHSDIEEMRDTSEEDDKEREAAALGLNYVNLGGDVACMVNGAGLAMATVDILKYYGGSPANFLDIGGQSSAEDNCKAFGIMLEGGQAKGIFVNIFGGINRCDTVASGLIKASEMMNLSVPIVVRLEGTKAKEGREILQNANVKNIIMAQSMEQGAELIVKLVKENEA